jgi:RNA polymerase sigma-70 factor (ECF subfamily)
VVIAGVTPSDDECPDCDDLNSLLREFRPRIYRYCRARLPDHEAAEDVTQDVLLALTTALPQRKPDHSLGGFVFGIAANKVAMALRSRYRRREDAVEITPDQIDSDAGPEQQAIDAETTTYVNVLLAQLPDNARHILTLRLAAGLSAEETGQVLGLTAGAVRVAQHRAVKQLRAIADREVLS